MAALGLRSDTLYLSKSVLRSSAAMHVVMEHISAPTSRDIVFPKSYYGTKSRRRSDSGELKHIFAPRVGGHRWPCVSVGMRGMKDPILPKLGRCDMWVEHCRKFQSSHGGNFKVSCSASGPSLVPAMIDYLNECWTPFHATAESKRQLVEAGFEQLNEKEEWDVQPGGKYFFTRNMSTIVAFCIGSRYKPGNGFNIIAAHTDSPCPKLKPVSAAVKSGFLNIGVQTYGGGLWHTWFDRDLSIAGRVLLHTKGGELLQKLVKVRRPIMRIPTLAIHFDRTVVQDGFKYNTESHLAPVLATAIKSELKLSSEKEEGNKTGISAKENHHSLLLEILADEIKCDVDEIVDLEMSICDTQPSAIGGARDEFIFSGRLDNLASSFCGLRALIDSCSEEKSLEDEKSVRMVALFDNEEVGSNSAQGAGSPTLFHAMKRVARLLARSAGNTEGIVERAIQRSFLVSADMGHALHPNYPDKHAENHQPKLNEGLIIKYNVNQRYATTVVTSFLFREIARLNNIPFQYFAVRNDMGCGSTIGPILSSGIGIRTVDVGLPQLSMHSVREMMGTADVDISYEHFKAFFTTFNSIDEKLKVDG